LGFAIFFTSNVLGSFVQIASLPVVILAPLGAVSLLWNAFFARFLLGDVFSPWMILGTLLIAGGAVLIGIFGIVPEPTRSLEDLLELFSRPAFVAYFSLLGAAVFICLAIVGGIHYYMDIPSLQEIHRHTLQSTLTPANWPLWCLPGRSRPTPLLPLHSTYLQTRPASPQALQTP
jgi:drug/metabolite transporter (DMT)-like permease